MQELHDPHREVALRVAGNTLDIFANRIACASWEALERHDKGLLAMGQTQEASRWGSGLEQSPACPNWTAGLTPGIML